MKPVTTFEQRLLNQASHIISNRSFNDKIFLLEAAACLFAGSNANAWWNALGRQPKNPEKTMHEAQKLVEAINLSGITPSLAISSLAKKETPKGKQKKNGEFYTDFRLAQLMAKASSDILENENASVADIAAGSGILLAAVAEIYKAKHPDSFDAWIENRVFAFDLNEDALIGAHCAFLAMTKNTMSVFEMTKKWKAQDSLLAVGSNQFDLVIGNPPWGKLKLSRHVFNMNEGKDTSYGSDEISEEDSVKFVLEKKKTNAYSKVVSSLYGTKSCSDLDWYILFLAKALSATHEKGRVVYLVPSGIIRSQGTQSLRESIFASSSQVSFELLDNKARFFSIDTRFKSVLLSLKKKEEHEKTVDFFTYRKIGFIKNTFTKKDLITFSVKELKTIRPDLTVPEFETDKEKLLFLKIMKSGEIWDGKNHGPKFSVSREVDMTNDKKEHFTKTPEKDDIPVIEGRMVQQFRFGSKAYKKGEGRSALWEPSSSGLYPQFFYRKSTLSEDLKERISNFRVGYCDIAGQTNERAMAATLIPKSIICGNKVPTILFENDKNCERAFLWIAVANSFVFDWMIRRIISTTVNYFLLFSVPLPKIEIDSPTGKEIIKKSKRLLRMDGAFYTCKEMWKLRADLDAEIAIAYGVDFNDLKVILSDFPLIDKKQTPLLSEKQSSITKDALFASFLRKKGAQKATMYEERLKNALKNGSRPYIPSEMISLCEE